MGDYNFQQYPICAVYSFVISDSRFSVCFAGSPRRLRGEMWVLVCLTGIGRTFEGAYPSRLRVVLLPDLRDGVLVDLSLRIPAMLAFLTGYRRQFRERYRKNTQEIGRDMKNISTYSQGFSVIRTATLTPGHSGTYSHRMALGAHIDSKTP